MPKLYAIADLHLGHRVNAKAFDGLQAQPPGTGLILAGDLGESLAHATDGFAKAKECFSHVFWVPGNHELYTMPQAKEPSERLKGEAKYNAMVEAAREHGVLTPEDDWMVWEYDEAGTKQKAIIALVFTLYDYSFRPPEVSREEAIPWARERSIEATDEILLFPDPYKSRDDWCHALCDRWEAKLRKTSAQNPGVPFVIVNHWPLREDLVHIPRVPRFSLWCGTKRTKNWHQKRWLGQEYPGAKVVVTGHLHVRRSDMIDGTRFEEVSLGYPPQWETVRSQGKGVNDLLREILPGDDIPIEGTTKWKVHG